MLNKTLIDNLNLATVNGSRDTLVELVSLYRLSKGLKTVKTDVWASCGDDGEASVKEFRDWLDARGYIKTLIGSMPVMVKTDGDGTPVVLLNFDERATVIHLTGIGDPDEAAAIEEKAKTYKVETKGMTILTAQSQSTFGGGRGINFDHEFVPESEIVLAKPSFYPWLPVSFEEYFKSYLESDEPVLVLIGEAGTGKSTFIRTLFHYVSVHHKESSRLAYDPDVVGSLDLVNGFFRQEGMLLAYEDMDAWLGKREDGNPFMATLLNQTQGVVRRKKKKLIFSTNLANINKIDEALLRVGRCFDILDFSKLNAEEAGAVAKDMGRLEFDPGAQNSWTLAEVLRAESKAVQRVNRFARKPGFGNSR
ncbi:MAG: AAA family ATPase [Sulfuriferula sp.]|nr:AAA family ATPase [Sulfuriferula sp.]